MDAARTLLFVPGSDPERFAKPLASGADAIVLDIEDAVALAAKAAARDMVAAWAGTVDRQRAGCRSTAAPTAFSTL